MASDDATASTILIKTQLNDRIAIRMPTVAPYILKGRNGSACAVSESGCRGAALFLQPYAGAGGFVGGDEDGAGAFQGGAERGEVVGARPAGTRNPTLASLYRLALALDVPLAALCPGDDGPSPPSEM